MYRHVLKAVFLCIVLAIQYGNIGAFGQCEPSFVRRDLVQAQEALYTRFKSGDTNMEIFRLDVFQDIPQWGVCFKDGSLFSVQMCDMFGYHGHRQEADPARLTRLIKVINALPPSSKEKIPMERQIHISGIRSNQWFHFVYDIGAYPKEIAEICRAFGKPFTSRPPFDGSQAFPGPQSSESVSNRANIKPGP